MYDYQSQSHKLFCTSFTPLQLISWTVNIPSLVFERLQSRFELLQNVDVILIDVDATLLRRNRTIFKNACILWLSLKRIISHDNANLKYTAVRS